MRIFNKYLLIFVLILLFSKCENKCKNENFFCRDEKIVDIKRGVKIVKIYYNGKLTEEYFSSKNHEKDSFYTDFLNGKKNFILEFENGLQNGLAISFYNNGDTELVQHFVNDTLNGFAYGYSTNKKIKYKQFFKMGCCDGQQLFDSIVSR